MLFKALLVFCVFHVAVEAAPWTYIGKACVGARNNHFKEITVHAFARPVLVGAIKLVHTHNTIGCHGAARSFWGCAAHNTDINIYVTDARNQPIYPSGRLVPRRTGGWYKLPGYTSSSPELVFTDVGYPKYFKRGDKIRIWYGEDLYGFTEHDNHGFTCMNIYAYPLSI